MLAVVYKGPHQMSVEQVEEPEIQDPTDAIIRVSSTAICGSDLHMYDGRTDAVSGMVFGHEAIGIVDSIGTAVQSIQGDDRVVLPFNIGCGFCFNCLRGFTSACLTTNPSKPGAAYGYVNMGQYQGCQAEYVRVPFADFNCIKLPGTPYDQWENDFLLLSDVFPTGYFGTELAHVKTGSTVAVFGAGPVGLLAAYSSILKGAGEVYVVDYVQERLDKAKEIGAIPIDFTKEDPVIQIENWRKNNTNFIASQREETGTKMIGVMCGIDAVGYQAKNDNDINKENPAQILINLSKIVNHTGHIGDVGVYLNPDPEGVNDMAKSGSYEIPWSRIFDKGIQIGTGQTPVLQYAYYLRDLIMAGRAKPSFIVTKQMTLEEAPQAYESFDKKKPGFIKVVLKTGADRPS